MESACVQAGTIHTPDHHQHNSYNNLTNTQCKLLMSVNTRTSALDDDSIDPLDFLDEHIRLETVCDPWSGPPDACDLSANTYKDPFDSDSMYTNATCNNQSTNIPNTQGNNLMDRNDDDGSLFCGSCTLASNSEQVCGTATNRTEWSNLRKGKEKMYIYIYIYSISPSLDICRCLCFIDPLLAMLMFELISYTVRSITILETPCYYAT